MYVETTETSSLIYTSSNHTAYHVCCIICEGISLSILQLHELNVIWNNAFRCIFNCCWRIRETSAVFTRDAKHRAY